MPTPDEIAAFLAALPRPKEKDASAVKATEMLAQNLARGGATTGPAPGGMIGEGFSQLGGLAKDVYQNISESFGPEGFGERYREAPIPQAAEAGPLGRAVTGPALRAGYSLATSPAATMLGEIGAATGFAPVVPAPSRPSAVAGVGRPVPEAGRAAERAAAGGDGRIAGPEHARGVGGVQEQPQNLGPKGQELPGATIRNFGEIVGPLGPPSVNDTSYLPKDIEAKARQSRIREMSRIPVGAQASGQTAGQTGFPTALQAPAPTKQQAAQLAATLPPGEVNRDVLRPLENVFHRLEGDHQADRLLVTKDLERLDRAGLLHSPTGEFLYRFGEGDPQFQPVKAGAGLPGPSLPPGLQSVWDQELQPWRAEERQLWQENKLLRKGANLTQNELDQIEYLSPDWMHRITQKLAERLLGKGEEDPVSGVRLGGIGKASSEEARNYFSLVNEKDGGRQLAYLDDNRNLFTISKTYPDGKLIETKQKFADPNFKPELGTRINIRGRNYRLQDAYTREIEGMIPGLKYAKDAFVSTRMNVLQLKRVNAALKAAQEAKQSLIGSRLASETRHAGWVKANNYPGLSGLYVPQRISAVLERFSPYVRDGKDVYDTIRRGVRGLVYSLFWNPLVHGFNVASHAYALRGWRNINPKANIEYLKHFADAWHDVSTASPDYIASLRGGARLMYANRRASFEQMNKLAFEGLRDFQTTAEGQGLMARLGKMDIPPLSFIKSFYKAMGDALWFGGDVLLQAAIREERARLYGTRKNETLAQTIMRVHKEIPSYRIPTEEMLPGQAGQAVSQFLRAPATNATLLFIPYHENVLRGYAMQMEDMMRGITRIKSKSAREDAIDTLGKTAAIAAAITYVYPQILDPAAKAVFGDKFEARRFGLFAPLQLAMDLFSNKHLSGGAFTRALSGGIYSPSPLVEIPFNLAGAHSYSMSALQPDEPPFRASNDWRSVPWSERLGTAATSITPVTGQIHDLLQGGLSGIPERLPTASGFASYRRQTEEERAAEKRRNYADPAYRAMVKRNKEKRGQKKPNRWAPVE